MNFILYFFGSGLAFFTGAAMILLGVVLRSGFQGKRIARLVAYLVSLGLISVILSATPFPIWSYGILVGVTMVWLKDNGASKTKPWLNIGVVVLWLVALGFEVPYQLRPSIKLGSTKPIYVIGDSVTAGIGGSETPWTRLLADSGFHVRSYAQPGVTTGEALLQAQQIPAEEGLVIIEMGGNDLLGSTRSAQFRQDLEKLLAHLRGKKHRLLMFELPLPPFCNGFGSAQRELSQKHGVELIPKRLFMGVFSATAGTIDSIHLSQAGHQQMAELVRSIMVKQ